jgi:hypothetical protein
LDPLAAYKVRVVYMGSRGPKVRLVANGSIEVHPGFQRPAPMQPVEFDIPGEAVRTGTLTLRWSIDTVEIAEVFLIRK